MEFDFDLEDTLVLCHMLGDHVIPDMKYVKFTNIGPFLDIVINILNTNIWNKIDNLIFMNNDGSSLSDELTEAICKWAKFNVTVWVWLYGFEARTQNLNKVLEASRDLEWIYMLYNDLLDDGLIRLDNVWYPNLKAIDIYSSDFTPDQEQGIVDSIVNSGLMAQLNQFNFITPNKFEHDETALKYGFVENTQRYDEYKNNYFHWLILKSISINGGF